MYRLTQAQASGLHRAASFTLAVWLGGVFCLFCCGRGMASVAEVTTAVVVATAAEPAPTAICASHACCREKAKSDSAPLESLAAVSAAGGRCCAAALGQAVVPPIKKKFLEPATAQQATWIPVASRDWAGNAAGGHESFYADRGETYLRCCVFLI